MNVISAQKEIGLAMCLLGAIVAIAGLVASGMDTSWGESVAQIAVAVAMVGVVLTVVARKA